MKVDDGDAEKIQRNHLEFLELLAELMTNLYKKLTRNQKKQDRTEVNIDDKPTQAQKLEVEVENEQVQTSKLEVEVEELEKTQKLEVQVNQEQNLEVEKSQSTSVEVAKIAAEVLEQHGQREGSGLVYKAEGYTLRSDENDIYSITDKKGSLLMQFKGAENPTIEVRNLDSKTVWDFARVHQQIQQKGFASLPEARLRQYQNLAPLAEVSLARGVKNIAAVITANHVLNNVGKDIYENQNYRLTRQGETVRIEAKDGRGEIARSQGGFISGNLNFMDIPQLNQMREVTEQDAHSDQNLHLPHQEAVIYDRLASVSGYTPQGAIVVAEQAVAPSEIGGVVTKELAYSKEEVQDLSEPESSIRQHSDDLEIGD